MMTLLQTLDLFSGIGGFSLGLERTSGFKTVAFCEIDDYCRRVLAKHWPGVPCYDDVRTIGADELAGLGRIDVITGGFPCQPVSVAGNMAAQNDPRWLWPDLARIICLVRPRWALLENVPGLLGRGMSDVLADLAGSGFDAEWQVLPAGAFGAPHPRHRVFIVAYPGGKHRQARVFRPEGAWTAMRCPRWGADKPGVARALDGVPDRVHRFECIGNAVVPQVVTWIGYQILAAEEGAA